MPGVLNWYINHKSGGDQFVEKCVSGRSRKSKSFAASPPYWDFSVDGREAKEVFENRLNSWLWDHLPVEAKDNLKICGVYKMMIAALVHHRDYLDKHLHVDSILECSLFWTDDAPFPEKMVPNHPLDATTDTHKITGVPPDIVLLAEMEGMQRKIANMLAKRKLALGRR